MGSDFRSLTNGAAIVLRSTHAAVLYQGAQGPLYRTTDLEGRWTRVRHTARFEQALWLDFARSKVGAALFTTRSHENEASLWRTTDGGGDWHLMPIR